MWPVVRSVQCRVEGVECGVDWGAGIGECKVWSVRVWILERGVRCVERGARDVQCKNWNVTRGT